MSDRTIEMGSRMFAYETLVDALYLVFVKATSDPQASAQDLHELALLLIRGAGVRHGSTDSEIESCLLIQERATAVVDASFAVLVERLRHAQ